MTVNSATARRLIVLVIIVAWELLPQLGLVPRLFLPPVSATVMALWGDFPEYIYHLWITLQEVAVSIVFACVGGIAVGLAIGISERARKVMLPLVSAGFAVPLVILYPLFTAWFGIGGESKIVFASVYGFLPTLLGTAAGVQTIDRHLVTVARSMGANSFQVVTRVFLPAAIPTVLSSLRIGGALVIVGVVVAEMLTSTAGIGFLISRYRTLLDSPHVFAAIILVLVLAIAFDVAVQWIERRTAGWQRAMRAERMPKAAYA